MAVSNNEYSKKRSRHFTLAFCRDLCPKNIPMKLQRPEPLVWGWQKICVAIRFFTLLCVVVAFFGCADSREKKTAAEISEHFKNYTKLKQNDPVGARGELYAAAYLLHNGHPKSKLWAEKVYEMDSTGRVSFSELLSYEILCLEIATDNGARKEVLAKHQEVVKATRQQIEALKAEGKDPQTVWTKAYTFDFSLDP